MYFFRKRIVKLFRERCQNGQTIFENISNPCQTITKTQKPVVQICIWNVTPFQQQGNWGYDSPSVRRADCSLPALVVRTDDKLAVELLEFRIMATALDPHKGLGMDQSVNMSVYGRIPPSPNTKFSVSFLSFGPHEKHLLSQIVIFCICLRTYQKRHSSLDQPLLHNQHTREMVKTSITRIVREWQEQHQAEYAPVKGFVSPVVIRFLASLGPKYTG